VSKIPVFSRKQNFTGFFLKIPDIQYQALLLNVPFPFHMYYLMNFNYWLNSSKETFFRIKDLDFRIIREDVFL
jgi:hypothetical protein